MAEDPMVRVQFFGICTHVGADSLPLQNPGFAHRVILVNASNPRQFDQQHPLLRKLRVDAHVARLQMQTRDVIGPLPERPWFRKTHDDGKTVEWDLRGVYLKIGNAIASVSQPLHLKTCIPQLSDYVDKGDPPTSDIVRPGLGPLGPRAYEPNAEQTACFFDFEPTPVVGKKLEHGGAAAAVLSVQSSAPMLVVTSFSGETITIPIRPDAEITVSNIPVVHKDDKDPDFLLHFLVLQSFPASPSFPTGPMPCAETIHTRNLPIRIGDLTTPGCSNSGYP